MNNEENYSYGNLPKEIELDTTPEGALVSLRFKRGSESNLLISGIFFLLLGICIICVMIGNGAGDSDALKEFPDAKWVIIAGVGSLGFGLWGIYRGILGIFGKIWLDISQNEIAYYTGFTKRKPTVVFPRDGNAYSEVYHNGTATHTTTHGYAKFKKTTVIDSWAIRIFYVSKYYDLGTFGKEQAHAEAVNNFLAPLFCDKKVQ